MPIDKEKRHLVAQLRARLGMTETQVAEFLAKKTKRPCSLRTVQSWTNDHEKKSARNCPDWAIAMLQDELVRRS